MTFEENPTSGNSRRNVCKLGSSRNTNHKKLGEFIHKDSTLVLHYEDMDQPKKKLEFGACNNYNCLPQAQPHPQPSSSCCCCCFRGRSLQCQGSGRALPPCAGSLPRSSSPCRSCPPHRVAQLPIHPCCSNNLSDVVVIIFFKKKSACCWTTCDLKERKKRKEKKPPRKEATPN